MIAAVDDRDVDGRARRRRRTEVRHAAGRGGPVAHGLFFSKKKQCAPFVTVPSVVEL
jgi:hypothetical protein